MSEVAISHAVHSYFLMLRHTPAILERIVDEVPPSRFAEHIVADRFNLIEMVAHMADWEVVFLDRMTLAFEKPGSTIECYDEGQRAIDKHYATRDIHHELDVFANRRRDTIAFIEDRTPEEMKSTMNHPEQGILTLTDHVNLMSCHDLYHIEQATWYFRGTHAK